MKCGAATLDVADRQNIYSITLAVRGVRGTIQTREARKKSFTGNPRLFDLTRQPINEDL